MPKLTIDVLHNIFWPLYRQIKNYDTEVKFIFTSVNKNGWKTNYAFLLINKHQRNLQWKKNIWNITDSIRKHIALPKHLVSFTRDSCYSLNYIWLLVWSNWLIVFYTLIKILWFFIGTFWIYYVVKKLESLIQMNWNMFLFP